MTNFSAENYNPYGDLKTQRNIAKGSLIVSKIVGVVGLGFIIVGIIIALSKALTPNKHSAVGYVIYGGTSSDSYNANNYQIAILNGYDLNKTYIQYEVELDDNTKEQHIGVLNMTSSSLYTGKTVKIYYIEGDYENIGCFESDYVLPLILIGIGAFSFFGVIFGSKKMSGKMTKGMEKIKENGKCHNCKIVDVKQNYKVSIGDFHPYIICLKDEEEIEDRIYESQELYFNPIEIIKKKEIEYLRVYVDKDDKRKYYVDVEKLVNELDNMIKENEFEEKRKSAGL